MGFLKNYLDNANLPNIDDKIKNNVDKLEGRLADYIKKQDGDFEQCIAKYAPAIMDLVSRVSKFFEENPITWGNAFNIFKFVYNIAIEAHQLVELLSGCVIKDGMTDEEKKQAKIDFGVELIYFVWMSVDPLKGRFNWVPFKKTIVKMVVKKRVGKQGVVSIVKAI
jgi:hypothetical protein